MQPSDFLTILGIGLAIWSFIPHKERDFILLFFSKFEIGLFISGLVYIHFLMSFDWLMKNWVPWLAAFTNPQGIPANIYSYILSLILIAWPIIKVTTGYFSSSRLLDLINLYESLIDEAESDLLRGYIEKYHTIDIQTFLKGLSHLPQKERVDFILRRRTESDEAYEKLISKKRIKFASYVYGRIIQNETFVKNVAPRHPELFAKIFLGMETKYASNEQVVKYYIHVIFEGKNQKFVDELKIVKGSEQSILHLSKNTDLPILTGLFVNTEAAAENQVWYPVGEGAINSIRHDNEQKQFLVKVYDSGIETELWNCKAWIATIYFNYMVRETIYRNSKWHMWLFYYRHMNDELIELIPLENKYDPQKEYPSFAHYIIYRTFDSMFDWIDLAKDLNTDNRVIDTIRCLGWCVHSLCQADEHRISRSFKKRPLDRLIQMYCDYAYEPDNVACTTTREWLLKLFLYPKGVDHGVPEITSEYLSLLEEAWNEFDKVPFTHHGHDEILEEFKNKVLAPLGTTTT